MKRTISCLAASVLAALSIAPVAAQTPNADFKAPPPAFADAQRRTRLEAAFPDIDRIFKAFTEQSHVPGASWGIVIDGELAHAGATGLRDVGRKRRSTRHGVSHRLDDQELTAIAILKLRDEGKLSLDDPAERYVPELKVSSTRPTTRRASRSGICSRTPKGFPRTTPGAIDSSPTPTSSSQMLRSGIPFSNAPGIAYEYSNYGFAILGRIVPVSPAGRTTDYVADEHPAAARDDVNDARAVEGAATALALGYRWEDEPGRKSRFSPHGSFGSMGGMLTTVRIWPYVGISFGVAAARRCGAGSHSARVPPRDAASVASRPGAVTRDASGRLQMNVGGYAFGLRVWQTCAFQRVVAHGGGLPGYGSQMRWLPEYGIGIIAFGNLRYTGGQRQSTMRSSALARTGALQPRAGTAVARAGERP